MATESGGTEDAEGMRRGDGRRPNQKAKARAAPKRKGSGTDGRNGNRDRGAKQADRTSTERVIRTSQRGAQRGVGPRGTDGSRRRQEGDRHWLRTIGDNPRNQGQELTETRRGTIGTDTHRAPVGVACHGGNSTGQGAGGKQTAGPGQWSQCVVVGGVAQRVDWKKEWRWLEWR